LKPLYGEPGKIIERTEKGLYIIQWEDGTKAKPPIAPRMLKKVHFSAWNPLESVLQSTNDAVTLIV